MTEKELDSKKSEAFAEKMLRILNSGALAIATAIGHRSGLFDAMSKLPPSTSEQIALAAGLNERYVREWLGAMVVGGVVEYNPKGALYVLPAEHAAFLTRAAAPNNLAVFMQDITMFATVEERVLECFKKGGGVRYSEFTRFHKVMAEESAQTTVAPLIDGILPLVPGLIDRLKQGIDVLDVGCGSGKALNLEAKTFPQSRFTGYDFSGEAIEAATAEANQLGLKNVHFEAKDVTNLDSAKMYDLITTFDAVHDQAHPDKVLAAIAKSLKPGGTYLMQDIASSSYLQNNLKNPLGPYLYTTSFMHCMTVSLALGGMGLGAMWGEETALKMICQAGFTKVEVKKLPGDLFNNYFIILKNGIEDKRKN